MNSLISRIREGIHSITSSPQRLAHDDADTALTEHFRGLMLSLAQASDSDAAQRLALRIRCATNIRSLWFMRSEVMSVLAPIYGESEAMHKLETISATVRESLPRGLRSRPSPLATRDNDSLRNTRR